MFKTAILCVLLAGGMSIPAVTAAQEPTTFIFVNPAEQDSSPSADPGLSETGRGQAAMLIDYLQDQHVEAVYASYTNCAMQTVRPLTESLRQQLMHFKDTDDIPLMENTLQAMIKKHKGKTIVICGNPKNIRLMALSLGIKGKNLKTLYNSACGEGLVIKVTEGGTAVAQKLEWNSRKKV